MTDMGTKDHRTKKRAASYLLIFFVLVLLFFGTAESYGEIKVGFSDRFLLFNALTILLLLYLGKVALSRYYNQQNYKYLILGVTFIGTGALHFYSALLSLEVLQQVKVLDATLLAKWGGLAAGLYFALGILFNRIMEKRVKRLGPAGKIEEKVVYCTAACLTILGLLLFTFAPLLNIYQQSGFIQQLAELVVAGIFLLVILSYLREGEWRNRAFEYWLILAMIVLLASHGLFLATADSLSSMRFQLGNQLQLLAFCVVLWAFINSDDETEFNDDRRDELLVADMDKEQSHYALYRLGIGGKLSILMALLMSLAIAITTSIIYAEFSTAMLEEKTEQTSVRAGLAANILRQEVEDTKRDTLYLADKTTDSISLLLDSEEVEANLTPLQLSEIAAGFYPLMERQQHYNEIQLISATDFGKELLHVYRNGPNIVTEIATGRQSTDKLNTFSTSSLSESSAAGVTYLSLSGGVFRVLVPVIDNHQQLFGYLLLNRTWRSMFRTMLNAKLESGTYLFDQNLKPLWRSDEGDISNDLVRVARYGLAHLSPGVGQVIEDSSHPELQISDQYYLSQINIEPSDQNKYVIFIKQFGQAQVQAKANAGAVKALWSGLVILGLVTLVGWLFSRSIIGPLRYIANASLVFGESGRQVRLPINAKDETGILARSIERMRNQVEERTSELEKEITYRQQGEDALKQAIAQAEQASHAKSDFLATMSHEIRTPMNGVLGMTQLLEKTQLNSQQREFVATIQQSGSALMSILNDILDFSKIEAGKMEIEPIAFDLEKAAHDVVHLLSSRAEEKGLELILHFQPGTPRFVIGDPGRMRQILINLISNAIKFTNSGHIVLTVKLEKHVADIANLFIEVEDTGIGIQADKLDHLFESFAQADATTTRRYGGTGLGLAISKQLVALMEGEMGVESEVGVGSKFWLRVALPITQDVAPKLDVKLSGVKVLVVDDNQTNRFVLAETFKQWNLKVVEAEDAKQGLDLLLEASATSAPFQVAILDQMMPGKDGIGLAQDIRACSALESLKLILFSSAAVDAKREEMTGLGFNGFLMKPIRSDLMKRTVAESLDLVEKENLIYGEAKSEKEGPTFTLAGKVLLVEDTLVNQKVAMSMLSGFGIQVTLASNGVEAVHKWSHASFDLILMDCLMPEMDGYEATQMIREREDQQHVPIIALTANALESARQQCLQAGMDDFLSKPFEQSSLFNMLTRWLPGEMKKMTITEKKDKTFITSAKVNMALIKSLQEALGDAFIDITRQFIVEAQSMSKEIQQASMENEIETTHRIAHSLKSSAGYFGAENVRALAAKIEVDTGASNLAHLPGDVQELIIQVNLACEQLDALVTDLA